MGVIKILEEVGKKSSPVGEGDLTRMSEVRDELAVVSEGVQYK